MRETGTGGERDISDLRLFSYVLLAAFVAVFASADKELPYHIDPFTNVLTAESIAATGSPILESQQGLVEEGTFGVFGWVVDSPRGPVSQYPPGTALFAAPFYLLDPGTVTISVNATNEGAGRIVEVQLPSIWPAAIASSLAVALAAAFTAITVRGSTESWRWGVGSAVLLVAGTGLWLNGGYQLWQHGVSAMWIASTLWLASRNRWLGSGFTMAMAILTRPPVAIVSAILGLGVSIRSRSLRPALMHGLGAAVGLAALLAYNHWIFGVVDVNGGYAAGPTTGPTFTDRVIEQDFSWYVHNIAGGLFSADRGLFIWSPFLAVAAVGIRRVWRSAPSWALFSAVGGVVLLLVQFRANRYSGGAGFFSYRYPLETVTASIPLLAVSARSMLGSRLGRRALLLTSATAIGLHLAALFDELTNQ